MSKEVKKERIKHLREDFYRKLNLLQKAKRSILGLFRKKLEEEKIQEIKNKLSRDY